MTRNIANDNKRDAEAWASNTDGHKDLRRFLDLMKGKSGEGLSATTLTAQELATYKPFWTTRSGMVRLRNALDGVIIRRDERSLDRNNARLLRLLDKVQSTSFIKLNAAEEAAMAAQTVTSDQGWVPMDLRRCNLTFGYDL